MGFSREKKNAHNRHRNPVGREDLLRARTNKTKKSRVADNIVIFKFILRYCCCVWENQTSTVCRCYIAITSLWYSWCVFFFSRLKKYISGTSRDNGNAHDPTTYTFVPFVWIYHVYKAIGFVIGPTQWRLYRRLEGSRRKRGGELELELFPPRISSNKLRTVYRILFYTMDQNIAHNNNKFQSNLSLETLRDSRLSPQGSPGW